MDKNNLFMKAYIIFLFICATVRVFVDLPIWSTLIPAITYASTIFAWADLDYTMACGENKYVSEYWGHISGALDEIKNVQSTIDRYLKETLSKEQKSYLETMRKKYDVAEERYMQLYDFVYTRKKSAITGEKRAKIEIVFGFLSLLCIIAFLPKDWKFPRTQDFLTIIGFAIVLYTQYISDRMRKWHDEFIANYENDTGYLMCLRSSFEREVKNYAH